MIVIVEGIDRVGKTTLCNKIHDLHGLPVFKHSNESFDYSKMDNDNETDKMLQLIELASITKSDVIFDRFHISDMVYGQLERNYEYNKAKENFKKIDGRLSKEDSILIHVYPSNHENLMKASTEHGKDLLHYFEMFMEFYEKSKMNKIMICYENFDSFIKNTRLNGFVNEVEKLQSASRKQVLLQSL